MTTKEIDALLEKYYDGKTTLREEHLLKEFFQGDNVPAELMEHKAMFGFFSMESKSTVSPEFEPALKQHLEGGRVISLNTRSRKMLWSLSLAASIVLIAGLVTVFKLGVFAPTQPFGTISDPQLAYAEARSALYLVSSRFNSGINQMKGLESFSTGYSQAQQLQNFQAGLDEINKITQLDKYQPINLNPGRTLNNRP